MTEQQEFDPNSLAGRSPYPGLHPFAIWYDTSNAPQITMRFNAGRGRYVTLGTFDDSDPAGSFQLDATLDTGAGGATTTPSALTSSDANNQLSLGSDGGLYVSPSNGNPLVSATRNADSSATLTLADNSHVTLPPVSAAAATVGGLVTLDQLDEAAEAASTDAGISSGINLVTNGEAGFGDGRNFSTLDYDPSLAPNLPGAFVFRGGYGGPVYTDHKVIVNPNAIYRVQAMVYQDPEPNAAGTGYEDRHRQFIGFIGYDADGHTIAPSHHAFMPGTKTTLAQPLKPGDTQVYLSDASNWDHGNSTASRRGLIVFGYKNVAGVSVDGYSRLFQFDMFSDATAIDLANNIVTLNKGLPSDMGNPDAGDGAWPVGTEIACSSSGGTFKYAVMPGYRPAQSGQWHKVSGEIGGIDYSGQNKPHQFPPGTASVKLVILPNYSNVPAANQGNPYTGTEHAVRFAGFSMLPDLMARFQDAGDGSQNLLLLDIDPATQTPVVRTQQTSIAAL